MHYDEMNRLEAREDARGEIVEYAYDHAGRISTMTTSAETVSYHYDTARTHPCSHVTGRLAGVEDGTGETAFCYDQRGRATRIETTLDAYSSTPLVVQQAYDSLDRLTTLTYPDGTQRFNLYDRSGQLSRVRFGGGSGYVYNLTRIIRHNAAGQITSASLGNYARILISYDSRLRPSSHRVRFGSDYLQNLRLTLDDVGNVLDIEDRVGSASASFAYDDLYRLVSATGERFDGETASYTYDPLGNLTNKTFTDPSSSLHVGSMTYQPDRVHAIDQAGGQSFAYDGAGNLVDDGLYAYEYTPLGMLERVTDGGSTTLVDNDYNYVGQRVVRSDDSGDTVFFLPHIDAELRLPSGGSATWVKHIQIDGLRVARVTDTFTSATVADAVELIATDHLGSPTLVMDTSGNVVERWQSHPFGEENSLPIENDGHGSDYLDPGDANTRLTRRFQGREIDPETGFYDFGARVYRPDLGRFLTPDSVVPDPLESQSFNRYAFVLNNPLRYVDPTGHMTHDTVTYVETHQNAYSPSASQQGSGFVQDLFRGLPDAISLNISLTGEALGVAGGGGQVEVSPFSISFVLINPTIDSPDAGNLAVLYTPNIHGAGSVGEGGGVSAAINVGLSAHSYDGSDLHATCGSLEGVEAGVYGEVSGSLLGKAELAGTVTFAPNFSYPGEGWVNVGAQGTGGLGLQQDLTVSGGGHVGYSVLLGCEQALKPTPPQQTEP